MVKYIAVLLIAGLIAVSSLGAAENIHYVNSKNVTLPCTIQCGPLGINSIEIWITSDNGTTWEKKAVKTPQDGELSCWVDQDGTYGFKTCVIGKNNLREAEPKEGDKPDIVCVVDTQEPDVSLISQQKGAVLKPGESAAIVWSVSDPHLKRESCMLRFSGDGGRSWKTGVPVKERGRKIFTGAVPMPTAVFEISAADKAGNMTRKVIAFSVKSQGEGAVRPVRVTDTTEKTKLEEEQPVVLAKEKKEDEKQEKGHTITIITDGQPQEYYITPIDAQEAGFTPAVRETKTYSEDDTSIVIIEGKDARSSVREEIKEKPVSINTGEDTGAGEDIAAGEIKKPEPVKVRKPVPVTEALDGQAVQFCRKAVDYEVFDNFEMAQKYYLMALKREPKYYQARKGLADLYFRNSHYKYAIKHFKVLTTIDPENTDIRVYYGFCLYKTGDPAKAEQELKKVLHIEPGNVDCMWYLSKIYKESDKIDDAVYLWIKLKNMGPRNNRWYDFADNYLNIYASRIGHS